MNSFYRRHGKRLLDIMIAGPALLGSLPLMAAVALLIRWRIGLPVLFRQKRPGKDAIPFTLIKFRTMTDQRGPDGAVLPDSERLTRLGQTLRTLSLDELPQLVNVLRGDMSLVGPRPLLMKYLDRYSPQQARRHAVHPGLTGWAQVHGRNAVGWSERFECDLWYVDNCSLRTDFFILFKTVSQVISRRGINAAGHDTMYEFPGNEEAQ